MKKLCIYHGNCIDGFTSAWAVWKKHPEAEFYPAVYGVEPPDCTGLDVIMVDFSYERPVLLELAKQARSILILDHHKSAKAELVDLPENVKAIFDMDRSGAMMTWEYFYPEKAPSYLIRHVQDRDLWRFSMEQTRAFQANLSSREFTFENWDMVNNLCADDYKYWAFVSEGESIERRQSKDIREFIAAAAYTGVVAGHEVPMLNAPYIWGSDAADIMGKGKPFAAYYWDSPGVRVFGLRSARDGLDVSEIAGKFGGGGHKHAAGFRLAFDDLYMLDCTTHLSANST